MEGTKVPAEKQRASSASAPFHDTVTGGSCAPADISFDVGLFDAKVSVCPSKGSMGGMCVAAKNDAHVMKGLTSMFGGKSTKRRWYEIDEGGFKWCAGHVREKNFKGIVPLSQLLKIKSEPMKSDLDGITAHSFEVETKERSFLLGCDSAYEKENWIVAFETQLANHKMTAAKIHSKRSMDHRQMLAELNSPISNLLGDTLEGFEQIDSNYASLEYSSCIQGLAGWADHLDLRDVSPCIAEYPEYLEMMRDEPCDIVENKQFVEISVCVTRNGLYKRSSAKVQTVKLEVEKNEDGTPVKPPKPPKKIEVLAAEEAVGGEQITFDTRCTIVSTVGHVLDQAIENLQKHVGKIENADCLVLQVQGEKNFLLHRDLPLGMYTSLDRASRMKETIKLSIYRLTRQEREALHEEITCSLEEWIEMYEWKYPIGFTKSDHKSFRTKLRTSTGEENKAMSYSEATTNIPREEADKELVIEINKIHFPPIFDLDMYDSMHLETSLVVNGKNILRDQEPVKSPLVTWIEQPDKSIVIPCESSVRTKRPLNTLPRETRVVFRLIGHSHMQGRKTNYKCLAGANTMLYNWENCMITVPFTLDLTNIGGISERTSMSTTTETDTAAAKDNSVKEMFNNIGILLMDEDGNEIPSFQSLHLEACLPTPKNRTRIAELDESGRNIMLSTNKSGKRGSLSRLPVINVGETVLHSIQVSVSFRMSKDKAIPKGYQVHFPTPSLNQLIQDVFESGEGSEITAMDRIRDTKVPNEAEVIRLAELENLSICLHRLTDQDKDLLWQCRLACSRIPNLLSKFLASVNWTDPACVKEAHVLILIWKSGPAEDSLELLDAQFSDSIVRQYAIQKLEELVDSALTEILLQLVQIIKYEPYHDSTLARFLLRRALLSPLVIGHKLFWMLYNELHLPIIQERFGLILTVYLLKCGPYKESLRTQVFVNNCFREIVQDVKIEETKAKRLEVARERLAQFNEHITGPFCLCLSPRVYLRKIVVEKCKVMESKMKPLWLVFEKDGDDGIGDYFNTIFKDGDDLRQDQLTLQLIGFMDSLWLEKSKEHLSDYTEPSTTDILDKAQGEQVQALLADYLLDTAERESMADLRFDEIYTTVNLDMTSGSRYSGTSGAAGMESLSLDSSGKQLAPPKAPKALPHEREEVPGALTIPPTSPSRWNQLVTAVVGSSRDDILKETLNYHEGVLDLKMKPYGCVSTGYNTGMLEAVTDSTTIAKIQTDYAGTVSGAFSKTTLLRYLAHNNEQTEQFELAVDNFIKTCAGYCVCTYVLGIGDRHPDNIMVQDGGHFFHIDFGHFLGNFKSKFGIDRERSPFVFTPEMAEVVISKHNRLSREKKEAGVEQPKHLQPLTEFEALCVKAFNILRKRSNLLIHLFTLMIPAAMPELQHRHNVEYLQAHLHLDLNDEEAADRFMKEIAACLKTWSRQVDNLFHNMKHYS